jgi:hypothetical protein
MADLLSITSLHPMREDAVRMLLAGGAADWSLVERLVRDGALAEIEYWSQKFYVRCFQRADARRAGASEGEDLE